MVRLEEIPAFAHLGKEELSGQSTSTAAKKPTAPGLESLMKCCAFCPTEKNDLYTCPRCRQPYCSLRCYRSRKHAMCSEKFYESWVRTESGEVVPEAPAAEPAKSFEQYMEGQNEKAPVVEEEGEPLDSDDEDLAYLQNVVKETAKNFEEMDDNELQRQLTIAGVAGIGDVTTEEDEEYQMKLLFESLTLEERREFQKMVDRMNVNEQGLTNSCFGNPK